MSTIVILGGTGYAGSNLAIVAAERGHVVTAVSRRDPDTAIPGVTHVMGDVRDHDFLSRVVKGDVVVSALSPRGDMADPGTVRGIEKQIAALAAERGIRFGVVGGAGSHRVSEDGPLLVDTAEFPEEARPEAR